MKNCIYNYYEFLEHEELKEKYGGNKVSGFAEFVDSPESVRLSESHEPVKSFDDFTKEARL